MIQPRIEEKLRTALAPLYLDVQNESHMHSVPPGSESHFKVVVVSERFAGRSPVERQRMVYEVLAEEMKSVHALAMRTLTPAQWEAQGGGEVTYASPKCRGGSKG